MYIRPMFRNKRANVLQYSQSIWKSIDTPGILKYKVPVTSRPYFTGYEKQNE